VRVDCRSSRCTAAPPYIDNASAKALRQGAIDGDRLPAVDAVLARVRRFKPSYAEGYIPRTAPKQRRIDPPVQAGTGYRRLSELDPPKP